MADAMRSIVRFARLQFRAQQLGSFDGRSWLWAWANTYLNIPDEMTTLARGVRDAADRLAVPALREPMIADSDEEPPHVLGGLAIAHGFGEAFFYANRSQIYLVLPGQIDELERVPAQPKRLATVFSRARRSLAEIVAHLRQDQNLSRLAWTHVDDDRATVAGTVTRSRSIGVIDCATCSPRSRRCRAARMRRTVVRRCSRSTARSIPGTPRPRTRSICEQLNRLDRVALYDALLGDFYPRSEH